MYGNLSVLVLVAVLVCDFSFFAFLCTAAFFFFTVDEFFHGFVEACADTLDDAGNFDRKADQRRMQR